MRHATHQISRILATSAIGLGVVLALSACAGDSPGATDAPASASASRGTSTATLSVTDPWAKATDSGMTAAFGTLVNDGDTDIHITSASSTAAAKVELHEMAADASGQMVMRPKESGFVVPAGGSLELMPGGLHLMLVGLTAPVKPGDDVPVTLSADDGSTYELMASARSYSGANESYGDGSGMAPSSNPNPTTAATP
ncbi:MAG TPA: copper chaperone PCu(A)C [Cellulomonas sp.]|uniref:copper chaperone PCu(A)C n=1 Tax=Cellulomonas sp. TaxID=40001 RepID=UPI002E34EB25|nr:copper chaperone PCu(A)C [Cellulomonas sp.]HEX5331252.1 copper chaperone PCu(A)C [Cellulomonas sp.]